MGRRRGRRTRQERRRLARLNGDTTSKQVAVSTPAPSRASTTSSPWYRRLGRLYGVDEARRYGAMVWLLAVGTMASFVGRGAAMPFVTIYLALVRNVISIPFAGVGVVLEQVLRAIFSPIFGGMSDRYGRKPFMVLGLVLQAASIPAYILVEGPLSYLAVSAVAGMGQAPYHPSLSAFLADQTPSERRVGVFGLVHMMKNLGFSVGIVAGSLLLNHGYAVLFIAGGIFPLLYAGLVAFFVREERPKSKTNKGPHPLVAAVAAARSMRYAAFILVAAVTFVSWGVVQYVLPVFIEDGQGLALDRKWVSYAFMLNSVLVVLFQVPVSEQLASRVSRSKGLAFASAVTGFAYVMLALIVFMISGNPGFAKAGLLLATAVITLAEMFDTPLLFALAADLAPPNMTGGSMGALGLPALVGFGAPLFFAGLLRDASGWPAAWIGLAILLVVGAFGYMMFNSQSPTQPSARKAEPVKQVAARAR